MIYLFTALYCEAAIFIKRFHLKKNPEHTSFPEFYRDEAGIRLTITGVGEIAAAAAVGSIGTKYKPKAEDILVNIGTCAHGAEGNGIFLCNKIVEQATGKTFYPDILFRHDFTEKTIVTGMRPWNGEKITIEMPKERTPGNPHGTEAFMGALYDTEAFPGALYDTEAFMGALYGTEAFTGALYDMESAAVYQAGSHFFGPHQMVFLKIVSDWGRAKEVSGKQVEHLMETHQDRLSDFVEGLSRMGEKFSPEAGGLEGEAEELYEKLCTDLHCSKVMGDSLRQHFRYWTLTGTDYMTVIDEMYGEGRLPCRAKREGKLCFEELKRRLF